VSTSNLGKIAFLFFVLLTLSICSRRSPDYPTIEIPDYPLVQRIYNHVWHLFRSEITDVSVNGKSTRVLLSDENFIVQNKTIYTALFGVYHFRRSLIKETLDQFYRGQREDGFIARVYFVKDGTPLHQPSRQELLIHPPLFATAELKLFEVTADTQRLEKVFKVLKKYFHWLDRNCATHLKGRRVDLYRNSVLGSGMINLPSGDYGEGAGVDISSQMALFAKDMAKIARIVGDAEAEAFFKEKCNNISRNINEYLWDSETGFYYNVDEKGRFIRCRTISGFWPIIAGVAKEERLEYLLSALRDTTKFLRRFSVPSVAASEPFFHSEGFYWRGAVWPSIVYMLINSLSEYGYYSLSREIAWRLIEVICRVYAGENPSAGRGKVWEAYSPDFVAPATDWKNECFCSSEVSSFVGLAAISMVIEHLMGFVPSAPEDKLFIRLPSRMKRWGIKNLHFGDNIVSIEVKRNAGNTFTFHGRTNSFLNLVVVWGNRKFFFKFERGNIDFTLIPSYEKLSQQ